MLFTSEEKMIIVNEIMKRTSGCLPGENENKIGVKEFLTYTKSAGYRDRRFVIIELAYLSSIIFLVLEYPGTSSL
jgi:hypothetical protein